MTAGRTVHIGRSDVETVRTMTDKVAEILDRVGAGHARPMAAAFLVNTAGPCLRARSGQCRIAGIGVFPSIVAANRESSPSWL